MKKVLLLIASAALLFAGCAKEKFSAGDEGGLVKASFTATMDNFSSKAVDDGHGTNVNRCIMEIFYGEGDKLYGRYVEDVTSGTATFNNIEVIANRTYKVAFWADCGGASHADLYYDATSLKAVKLIDPYVSNLDERDAFFSLESWTPTPTQPNGSSTLHRPFAQVNVITTDWLKVKDEDLAPSHVSLEIKNAYTQFNLLSGELSAAADLEYTAEIYENASYSASEATLSMDYLFASSDKAVIDIDWTANQGTTGDVDHTFSAVPYQRNYRTNIKGALLTQKGQWTVTVEPAWASPAYEHPVVVATTLEEAQAAAGPATSATPAAGTIIVKDEAVENRDQTKDKDASYVGTKTPGVTLPDGAKAIEFVLTPNSLENVGFELPALPSEDYYWYIRHEEGYPTQNLKVNVASGDETRVIIDAPDGTHVELNDAEYVHVIALTGDNTLVVPAGIEVGTLTVKKGGLEIHGDVETLEIQPETGMSVYVRSCEGLSESVFAVIKGNDHNYIAPGYAAKAQATTPVTYNIVPAPSPTGDVFHAANDTQLAEVLEEINANSAYWGQPYTIQLGAGTFDADITLKQYPEWNGVKDQRWISESTGRTKITLRGAENFGTEFNGTINVYGNGNSNDALSEAASKVYTAISGIKFTTPTSKFPVRAVYSSSNVTVEGCEFVGTERLIVGESQSSAGYSYNFTLSNSQFEGCDCVLQGYATKGNESRAVTINNADGSADKFLNLQGGADPCYVSDCEMAISDGEYGIRTNSDSKVNVSECEFHFHDNAGQVTWIRGNNVTITLDNCTVTGSNTLKFKEAYSNSKVVLKGSTSPDEFKNEGGESHNVEDLRVMAAGTYTISTSAQLIAFANKFNSSEKSETGNYILKLNAGTYEFANLILVQQDEKPLTIQSADPENRATLKSNSSQSKHTLFALCAESSYSGSPISFKDLYIDNSAVGSAIESYVFYAAGGGSGLVDQLIQSITGDASAHRYVHDITVDNCDAIANGVNAQFFMASSGNSATLLKNCEIEDFGYFANGPFTHGGGRSFGLKAINCETTNCKVFVNNQSADDTKTIVTYIDDCDVRTYHDYTVRIQGGHLTIVNTRFYPSYTAATMPSEAGVIVVADAAKYKSSIIDVDDKCTFTKTDSNLPDLYVGKECEVNGTPFTGSMNFTK